ncbi:hypothetical protein KJ644_03605 [Candidatus Dependentiae bacterium]|nr:hypothetical protein [Candidatus Dependentiae bacterium]
MSFLKIFFLISFCFGFSGLFAQGESDYDPEFYDDLKQELTNIITEKFIANEQSEKYSKHIEDETKRHVKTKLYRESKNHVRNEVYKKDKKLLLDGLYDKVFLYKVPDWPFYTQPFMQKYNLQADLKFDFVDDSYYLGGAKHDLSNLLFNQNDLRLKDILLAAKLMRENKIFWQKNTSDTDETKYNSLHYFYILADQPMLFNAKYNKQTLNLNFAKHALGGDFTIGVQLPVSRQHNKIDLVSDISDEDKEKLRLAHEDPEQICPGVDVGIAGPNFFERYGTLEAFLVDILKAKGIEFNKSETVLGLSDLSLFFNVEFDWKHAERILAGLNFIVPTSKNIDTAKLWYPELGNGGFYGLEAFGSILFAENRWFNPHAFLNLSLALPARVKRRVPKYVSYDGITPAAGKTINSLVLSPQQQIYALGQPGIFTNELDANAKRFSDTAQKINIFPGPKIFLRLGNIFERVFWKNAFFDLYYDLGLKFKDYTGGWLNSAEYAQSIITDNSWYIENRIGASYSYQIDERFRFNLGFLYTFAGTNAQELLRINLSANFEF